MADQFGHEEFVSMLATRMTMAYNYAREGRSRLGSGNLDGLLDDVGMPPGGFPEELVNPAQIVPAGRSVLLDFCGLADDPEIGPLVDAPADLINRELVGFGTVHSGLFDQFSGLVLGPLAPGLTQTVPVPQNRMEELLRSTDQKIQAMVAELNQLYDALSPMCSGDPIKCKYSPSRVWDTLAQGLARQRGSAEAECLALTGDDLDQASIYEAHFSRPEIPSEAIDAYGCQHQSSDFDIDYAASVANFRQLLPNIEDYREARECYFSGLMQDAAEEVRDEMLTDAITGDPRLGHSHSAEKTIGGRFLGASVRHLQVAKFDVPKNGNGQALLGDALDNFCSLFGQYIQVDELFTSILGDATAMYSSHGEFSVSEGFPIEPFQVFSLEIEGRAGAGYQVTTTANGFIVEGGSGVEGHVIAQLRTPFAFNLLGFEIGAGLQALAAVAAHASGELELAGAGSICDPQLGARIDLRAGLAANVEVSAEVFAIDVIILEAGVRGVVVLVELDVGSNFNASAELGDIFNESKLIQDAFGCLPGVGCSEPAYEPMVDLALKFGTTAKGRLFGGRIELFVRLNLLFVNPEASVKLVGWKGRAFDLIPEVDEEFEFSANPGLWCHEILFGTNHPACN